MAVQRAWIKQEGTVVSQLSDEQMDEFVNNVLDGLYRLAVLAVTHINEGKTGIDGKSPKSNAVTAVENFVSNV